MLHIIFSEGCQQPYFKAKEALVNHFSPDKDSKIAQLMYGTKLPSNLMQSKLLAKMRQPIVQDRRA